MTRLKRVGMVLLLAILTTLPTAAKEKAKDKLLFEKGQDAEVRQNYEAAYNYFKQAYDLMPQELSYRLACTRTKFLAAAAHVHRGHMLLDDGKLPDALAEFQAAKLIDPSQPIIDQDIRQTRALIERASRVPSQAPANSDDH